jgi:hypothetical protein
MTLFRAAATHADLNILSVDAGRPVRNDLFQALATRLAANPKGLVNRILSRPPEEAATVQLARPEKDAKTGPHNPPRLVNLRP